MDAWLDVKYANLVSSRLDRFKVKKHNPYEANFRCPICGDSKRSRIKSRGWLYLYKNSMFYHCFNCNAKLPFGKFLKTLDPVLFSEYRLEKFRDSGNPPIRIDLELSAPIETEVAEGLSLLPTIADLPHDFPARKYVESRFLPPIALTKLHYCRDFARWTNMMIPDKLKYTEERIVIPFLDFDGHMFGYQGRSLDPGVENRYRYISIMLEERPKVFGLDRVDLSRRIYVTEGPIDSFFLPNCIAMAGSDFSFSDGELVYVYDNEPRSREIVGFIQGAIDRGDQVVIWPKDFAFKDLNDAVIGGVSVDSLQRVVEDNTYSGVQAKLRMMEWKRI